MPPFFMGRKNQFVLSSCEIALTGIFNYIYAWSFKIIINLIAMFFNAFSILLFSIALLLSPVRVIAKDTLVVGMVSKYENPEHIRQIEEKANKVIQELSHLGIQNSELLIVKDVKEMIAALKNNQVDWLAGSLFPSLVYADEANAKIFVQRYKNGVKKFRSVFFVRKESDLASLDKLERKKIAFGDSFSTSSYFLPYYELFENNYTLVEYGQPDDKKLLGKKRVYYTNMVSANSIVTSVLETKADIGVLSNLRFDKIKPGIKQKLKIIHETAAFPVTIEVVRENIESSIRDALINSIAEYNAAINYGQNKEQETLRNENRFYDLVGEGRDGYVYLKNIIKSRIVPVALENK